MTPGILHLCALLLVVAAGCSHADSATEGLSRPHANPGAGIDDGLAARGAAHDESAESDTIELSGHVRPCADCTSEAPLELLVRGARGSSDARGRELARTTLDSDGGFRLRIARRHAMVELELDSRRLRLFDDGPVDTQHDRTLELVATSGTWIAGTLQAPPDSDLAGLELLLGCVPSAAELALQPIVEPGRWWSSYLGRATLDAGGRFEFRGVPCGVELRLRTLPAGCAPVCAAIGPLESGGLRGLALPLASGVTLRGRIVDRDGQPLARARLVLDTTSCFERRWSPQSETVAREPSDPDHPVFGPRDENPAPGVFVLRDLPAGPLRMHAIDDDCGPAELELAGLRPGETRSDLVLTLRSAPRVEGRVLDAQGQPLAGARVVARWIDVSGARDGRAALWCASRARPARDGDAAGRFGAARRKALRAHRALGARGRACAREPLELVLAPGAVAPAELVLVPGALLWVELAGAPTRPSASSRSTTRRTACAPRRSSRRRRVRSRRRGCAAAPAVRCRRAATTSSRAVPAARAPRRT